MRQAALEPVLQVRVSHALLYIPSPSQYVWALGGAGLQPRQTLNDLTARGYLLMTLRAMSTAASLLEQGSEWHISMSAQFVTFNIKVLNLYNLY